MSWVFMFVAYYVVHDMYKLVGGCEKTLDSSVRHVHNPSWPSEVSFRVRCCVCGVYAERAVVG